LFVLPSLAILIALTWIYLVFGDVPVVAGVLYGIKPAVTAIVVFAAYRIGSRALRNGVLWAIAASLPSSRCMFPSRLSCWGPASSACWAGASYPTSSEPVGDTGHPTNSSGPPSSMITRRYRTGRAFAGVRPCFTSLPALRSGH
jgi:hypothetical protein